MIGMVGKGDQQWDGAWTREAWGLEKEAGGKVRTSVREWGRLPCGLEQVRVEQVAATL